MEKKTILLLPVDIIYCTCNRKRMTLKTTYPWLAEMLEIGWNVAANHRLFRARAKKLELLLYAITLGFEMISENNFLAEKRLKSEFVSKNARKVGESDSSFREPAYPGSLGSERLTQDSDVSWSWHLGRFTMCWVQLAQYLSRLVVLFSTAYPDL